VKIKLCVTGLWPTLVAAQVFLHPLNGSVVFFKTQEVILTSDIWRVVINLDLEVYEDIVSTVRNDLHLIQTQMEEFTSVQELQQVEKLLNNVEVKLLDTKQVLPHLDLLRGLINLGGKVLQVLFGAATVADIEQLH
jgi:signal-transduction protein with cAMP-binding, CBS, and nucleotidyltransferase domain